MYIEAIIGIVIGAFLVAAIIMEFKNKNTLYKSKDKTKNKPKTNQNQSENKPCLC